VDHELSQAAPEPVDGVSGAARGTFAPRTALALLCALLVLDFADRQVVVTAFPYLRAEFGVNEAQLGALVSAVSVVIALTALPIALVIDRRSRVRAIAIMGSLWSVATAACAFAPGYVALLAARLGIGVGQAGFGPAGSAVLGAAYPPERRATVLGVFQMGAPIGVVTGSVVGSLVAAHWGWRPAFLVVALPGLVLALLALRLRDYRSVPQRSRGRAAAARRCRERRGPAGRRGACCRASPALRRRRATAHATSSAARRPRASAARAPRPRPGRRSRDSRARRARRDTG